MTENPTDICWLHLSDFHFKTGKTIEQTQLRYVKNMIRDIKEIMNLHDLKLTFVVITGDLAYNGIEKEYKLFEPVIRMLEKELKLDRKKNFFIVPGNHDVDLSKIDCVSLQLNNSIYTKETVNDFYNCPEMKKILLDKLQDYFKFMNETFDIKVDHENFYYIKKVGNIAILGFNSVWLSNSRESNTDYQKLFIGESQINDLVNLSEESDFVIALSHHPLEWLNVVDKDNINKELDSNIFDLYLCGHLHNHNILIQQNDSRKKYCLIQSGASFEVKRDDKIDNYIIVKYNVENKEGICICRRFNGEKWDYFEDKKEVSINLKQNDDIRLNSEELRKIIKLNQLNKFLDENLSIEGKNSRVFTYFKNMLPKDLISDSFLISGDEEKGYQIKQLIMQYLFVKQKKDFEYLKEFLTRIGTYKVKSYIKVKNAFILLLIEKVLKEK